MTEVKHAIIDPFPVSELGNLYVTKEGTPLKKSAIHDRITALGIKSFPQRGQGSKRFINAADVLRLNMLNVYIRENGTMAGFPGLLPASGGSGEASSEKVPPSSGNNETSGGQLVALDGKRREKQTLEHRDLASVTLWQLVTQVPVEKIPDYLIRPFLKPFQDLFYPPARKMKDSIEVLLLAAHNDLRFSTSRSAYLLDVSPEIFSGKKSVTRMGFKFIRDDKEGRERGWKVQKANQPPLEDDC